MTYHHQSKRYGKTQAANWLTARLQMLEKVYGNGAEARIRGYMRLIEDNETGEM